MKKFLKLLVGLIVILGAAFWWLMLEGKALKTSSGEFKLSEYRGLIAADNGIKPQAIHVEITGSDPTPGFAADAGNFSLEYTSVYSAFQIVWPDMAFVIGRAVDGATASEIAVKGDGAFDAAAYTRLTSAMEQAEQIWLTHEHIDHVMAIARHPNPALIAPLLKLNSDQLGALSQFALNGLLAPEIKNVTPLETISPQIIAPGVVVDRTPGHTPGSQILFVTLDNGDEYLFVGDIIWNMVNLDSLKTRPRLLQYMFFEPNEDRKAVLRQVRELHDIQAANSDLNIVPAHDGEHLEGLIAAGKIMHEFTLK